ncbi:PAS domain-containing protein [bacterium]|nr:PAS domain-containing protein [bacterium]
MKLLRSSFRWRLYAALLLLALWAMLYYFLIGPWAGLTATLLVIWPLSIFLSAPLEELARGAARAVQDGETSGLPTLRRDEFGQIAEALRELGEGSQQRIAAINEERKRLLAILGGMIEGVIAIDREDRVVQMNRVAGQIFHVDAEQCIGKRIYEAVRVPDVIETFAGALQHGRETTAELRLPEKDRDVLVELYASPLNDEAGQRSGAVMVLHNVTQIRRLEGMRRDFVANVSHELKTPLTAIRGFVETMVEDQEMPAERRQHFVRRINDQTQRLSAIVSDLLTISRIESGGTEMEREALDLRDVARDCERLLSPAAEAKRICLSVDIPEQAVRVLGDREALRQALSNLVDNAVKYTPEGGQVWLRVRVEERMAVAEVQDTGIGISPQDQQRIFERFYRVDKARSRELGGTGLGLSIVKHITLALGGRVGLDSSLGKGSTFRMELPLA